MGESKTSKNRLVAVDRQRQALELRAAGHSFESIAQTIGYSGPSGAYKAVVSALDKTLQEPAENLRQLELERLDAMLTAIWPQALKGYLGAIDRVLKIIERRSKLLGLENVEQDNELQTVVWAPLTSEQEARIRERLSAPKPPLLR